MDYRSKIEKAVENGLKSEPEFLENKNLTFVRDRKYNMSQENTDVEVYIEDIDEDTYVIYIYGIEYVSGMCCAIRNFLRKASVEEVFVRRRLTENHKCIEITVDFV